MTTKKPSTGRRHVADYMYDTAARMASASGIDSKLEDLPALSLYAFVTSLMTLGSRVLRMGRVELGIAQILQWQRPAMTFTILFAYTCICYHPQWLLIMPLFYFTCFVLFPNYAVKFKIDEHAVEVQSDPLIFLSEEEKKKNSRNLLTAIKQGQKSLANLVDKLDKLDEFREGPAKFQDVQVSSMMLVASALSFVVLAYLLSFLSMPFFCSSIGWSVVLSKHPLAKLTTQKLEEIDLGPEIDLHELYCKFVAFCHEHVLFDDKPLRRVVEIYQLQPEGLTVRQWKTASSIYSTSPYVLQSPNRVNKEGPVGAADLADVEAPQGWYFDLTDDWVCDKDALLWTSMAGISDVEASGQWAYDVQHEGPMWRRCRLTRYCYYDFRQPGDERPKEPL